MMDYFANKDKLSKRAIFITKNRAKTYEHEIQNSIAHTMEFKEDSVLRSGVLGKQKDKIHTPETSIVQLDTVSTIFQCTADSERVAVLNFASYKHPGGMFIAGSSAQEESLCHASTLYNVLSSEELSGYYEKNNKDKNRALYYNRALYSQSVVFFDNRQDDENVGTMRLVDVITCAAPNAGTFLRYNTGEGAVALNEHILADRILFLHDICEYAAIVLGLETVILGAWGCGVFRQNPHTVAHLLMTEFKESRLNRVIFGVPDEKTFTIFQDSFHTVFR